MKGAGRILFLRHICVLGLLCTGLVSASCIAILTRDQESELRDAFDRYFEVRTSNARYGDVEAMREVVTLNCLDEELLSAENTTRDLGVRHEVVRFRVLSYASTQAQVRVHWKHWHRNVNIVTGEEFPILLMEMDKVYDFVKEDGRWKVDKSRVVRQIQPPLP